MRTYEAVFILDNRKLEDDGEAFSREIAEHIKTLGGTVQKRISLGRKQFARPIGKHKAGVYWDYVLDLAPESVAAFQDNYKFNNTVLRLVVFLYEEPPEPVKTDSAG